MRCPKCDTEMVLKKKDNSFNFDVKPKKKYERSMYWCEKDDIWISIETPVGENR